jgi:cytochrome c oxidase subunit 1
VSSGIVAFTVATDHKVIARRMVFFAIAFFLAGGVMALVMRAELAEPGLQVVSADAYNALFTMHGSTMIYLFITPLAYAFGLYLVPLQLGAAEVAGPRAALAGSWLVGLGGIVMYAGFLAKGGAAKATWVGFDPLGTAVHSPGSGMDLWIAGVFLAAAGSLVIAFCLLFTVLRKRAPGMTLLRMPVFTWTIVATVLMTVVSFPVLLAAMGLLWAERQGGDILGGGVTYQHLFWFFGHPVVYVMFFPFLGAVLEVLATFSGRRFFGYTAFVGSILFFASLSVSVWAHHMFTTGVVSNRFFSLTSTALVVPAGMEYVSAIGTMWGGRIRVTAAFLFAVGFLVEFLVGGLSGIWVASPPLDYHANNSYIVVAHLHFVLVGGSLFGIFCALYYWWPKITGWRLGERLGIAQCVLLIIGTNLTFIPQFALGEQGMARRVADYPRSAGWEALNMISTVGSGVIALAILVFLLNLALSWAATRPAGPDPWEGHTLEWATSSPPPRHNFDGPLPPVRSPAPLWDLRHAEAAGG